MSSPTSHNANFRPLESPSQPPPSVATYPLWCETSKIPENLRTLSTEVAPIYPRKTRKSIRSTRTRFLSTVLRGHHASNNQTPCEIPSLKNTHRTRGTEQKHHTNPIVSTPPVSPANPAPEPLAKEAALLFLLCERTSAYDPAVADPPAAKPLLAKDAAGPPATEPAIAEPFARAAGANHLRNGERTR